MGQFNRLLDRCIERLPVRFSHDPGRLAQGGLPWRSEIMIAAQQAQARVPGGAGKKASCSGVCLSDYLGTDRETADETPMRSIPQPDANQLCTSSGCGVQLQSSRALIVPDEDEDSTRGEAGLLNGIWLPLRSAHWCFCAGAAQHRHRGCTRLDWRRTTGGLRTELRSTGAAGGLGRVIQGNCRYHGKVCCSPLLQTSAYFSPMP
jgi:hypothetical protein